MPKEDFDLKREQVSEQLGHRVKALLLPIMAHLHAM